LKVKDTYFGFGNLWLSKPLPASFFVLEKLYMRQRSSLFATKATLVYNYFMVKQINFPDYSVESKYLKVHHAIAGVDEVGVGPLAGPVVAAAVVLDPKKIVISRATKQWWHEVRDSKKLTHRKREELVKEILRNAKTFGIGSATVLEIDELNILKARLLAMKRAIKNLKYLPQLALIDGNKIIPQVSIKQECIIKGDEKVLSIACASIIAKVTRDNILKNLHKKFPEYRFDKHKGYSTKLHKEKIKEFGLCDEHRKTFGLVREILNRS